MKYDKTNSHTMPDGTKMSGKTHTKASKPVKEVKAKAPKKEKAPKEVKEVKEKKPRVSRKDNKDYEKKTITTKSGKTSSVYVKKLATNLPSDIDKPITSPKVEVEQAKADLKANVIDGMSQKELDKLERVKKRIAKKQQTK